MTAVLETSMATTEMLDPKTLIVDINVRKEAELTSEFVFSIKENGVLVPVVAHQVVVKRKSTEPRYFRYI